MAESDQHSRVIERDGEVYYSVEEAGNYLGKSRSSLYRYLRQYNVPSYTFPLEGKAVYFKRSALDALRNAPPSERRPKSDAA